MKADKKIDLCGIVEPCCFLVCKSAIASLKPGGVLEIQVRDPETIKDLMAILEHSGETIVGKEAREDRTWLWVRKTSCGSASLNGPITEQS